MAADKYPADYRPFALIGAAVGEMVVPVLIGVWADDYFGSGPWGMVVGAVVGVGGGMTHLILQSRRSAGAPDGGEGDGGQGRGNGTGRAG